MPATGCNVESWKCCKCSNINKCPNQRKTTSLCQNSGKACYDRSVRESVAAAIQGKKVAVGNHRRCDDCIPNDFEDFDGQF
jgi:hypothetical protein